MERNGDRKEMGFPRDCTPALCLAPCHPTAPGLTEGRGNNAEALPCRAAVPEPARGRGAVAPPRSAGAGPRRAGGSGNSRTQAPPAHFAGKTPNTRPLWGSATASSGRCGCATRVAALIPPAGGTLPDGQSPAPARDPAEPVPGQAKTPRRGKETPGPPQPAPAPHPCPRLRNIWTTKAAVGLNGPD